MSLRAAVQVDGAGHSLLAPVQTWVHASPHLHRSASALTHLQQGTVTQVKWLQLINTGATISIINQNGSK